MVSILINDDILLRSYEHEDAPELFRAVNESREHLRPWFVWVDQTTKQEHSLHFIQHSLQQLNNQEGLALGIFYKRQIIGSVGMHNWDHTIKKAQIGYWIDKAYEGKGIINQCMTRFVDFLFKKVGLNKVEIHFISSNDRSAHVAERLGCKVEGVIRQSFLKNGKLEDVIVTGILKTEWQPVK
ncbi:MAG TPA: GNAT family protein [Flavipsychrobacter sp.]|nr:GNAT family protein [Flavipsychrobacter sp.]